MEIPPRDTLDAFSIANDLPVNSVRIVATLVFCVCVAPFTHVLPNPSQRHGGNALLGLLCGWFCFDLLILHSLAAVIFTLAVIHLAPRHQVGTIATIANFTHLFYSHFCREFLQQDIIWDAAQMVLALKLIGVAISYGDGALPAEKKTKIILQNQLLQKPSILALFGYIYFYPTFLVGPVFEFNEYLQWVDVHRYAPLYVQLHNLTMAIVCVAGYVISDLYFPVASMDSAQFYPQYSYFFRLVLQCTAVMLFRFRFYMVWQLGELAAVFAGYGYNCTSNEWDGLRNNNILLVEFPTNFRVAINNWNIRVSTWLNAYVYQRLGLKHGRPTSLSTFYTFLVSALWHGFLPGYYQFFIMGALYIELGKYIRRRYRSYFHYTEDRGAHPYKIFGEYFDFAKAHPLAIFYDLGGMFFTWMFMQYIGASFVLQDMTRCFTIWSGFYFIPHILPILYLLPFQYTEYKSKEN